MCVMKWHENNSDAVIKKKTTKDAVEKTEYSSLESDQAYIWESPTLNWESQSS